SAVVMSSVTLTLLILSMRQLPRLPTPFPYTTLFRSPVAARVAPGDLGAQVGHRHRLVPAAGRCAGRPPAVGQQPRGGGVVDAHHRAPPSAQSLHQAFSSASTRAVRSLMTACRSEEHTSELQSRENLVCRLLLE